ncbi:HAD-IC family P-type ATPase [Mariniluteicoccus flavus]
MQQDSGVATPLTGLTAAEVAERVARGETNAAAHGTSRSVWQITRANLFNFFNNILFVIGAALIALGRYNDAFTSVGLGLINALIGTVQEVRAKKQLDRIALTSRVPARVVRDGAEVDIDPDQLVLGDVVVARPGDQVLVDGRVTGDTVLGIDESLLTGEADVLRKAPGDAILSGSVVVSGHGHFEATGVGEASYAHGLTASAREFVPTQTPLQRQVNIIVRAVTLVVALMSFAILFQAILENFALARIVQVSAVLSGQVPYGLFFLIALAYAAGAATLARRGALVQQTNAVESLANIDTVCLDKTGTLTANRLELAEVHAFVPASDADVRRVLGAYAHSTGSPNGTSEALAAGLPGEAGATLEVPFQSSTKWSAQSLPAAVLGDRADDWATLVLGAPEVLAPHLADAALFAPGGPGDAQQAAWTDRGLRVLLVAASPKPITPGAGETPAAFDPRSLTPVALVALRDELRPQALETLKMLAAGGTDIKIISGDSPRTVAALAKQADLGPDILMVTGPELDALGDGEFAEAAKTGTIFGRATPAHKERLVQALKAQGRYVAMLGDGTNDALSLKRADVGIAMESGATITRNVADMVLLKDSFAAVGPAMIEGRRIADGLTKSLYLFIPRVITSILVIVFVTMLGMGFPYSPAQVALTLFTVGIPSLALTLWSRPDPVKPHLLRRIVEFALPAGIVTAVFATSIYAMFHELIARSFQIGRIPPGAAERWAQYTGVAASSSEFSEAAATIIAQTAMSTFVSFCAFGLILFVEPPARFFTGWAPVSPDKRPLWLVVGLFATYMVVLHVEVTANYFGLLTPHGPEWKVYAVAFPLWFLTLRTLWRHRLFPRMLGLD